MPKPDYPKVPTIWVDARTVQIAFNLEGIWGKVLSGEYTIHPGSRLSKPFAVARAGQPAGTRSQHPLIINAQGDFVAHCHRYLRDQSEQQLARRPDPKRVYIPPYMFTFDDATVAKRPDIMVIAWWRLWLYGRWVLRRLRHRDSS